MSSREVLYPKTDSIHWGCGRAHFTLCSVHPEVMEHAHGVFSRWPLAFSKEPSALTWTVEKDRDGWRIQAPHLTLTLGPEYQCAWVRGDERQAVKMVEFQAVATAALTGEARPGFHGSLLSHQGAAIGIVGGKEAGKSTLSVALSQAGFTMQSDDGFFLDQDNSATPVPRRSRLRPQARALFPPELWNELESRPTSLLDSDGSLLFHGSGEPFTKPVPLKALVLLETEPGPIERLTEAQGLLRLLVHSYLFARLGIRGTLLATSPLTDSVPCFRLGRGPLDSQVETIQRILL